MSVAFEDYAVVPVVTPVHLRAVAAPMGAPAIAPDRRPVRPAARRPATVTVLHAPRERDIAPPLRLTRRGVVVLSLLVAALAGALVWIAAASAPNAPAATPQPAVVTVHAGDTVWSIASRYAAGSDPRAMVADIQRRNHLVDMDLVPGQVLHLH